MKQTAAYYLSALLIMIVGMLLAARQYPNGFDWAYTVASALMSQKRNPDAGHWFALGLSLSMLMLWFYVNSLKPYLPAAKTVMKLLRIGMICGMLIGVERLVFYDLSRLIHKAHELIALLAFAGQYFGIMGLLINTMIQQPQRRLWMLLALIPLTGVTLQLFWLYLTQRGIGWVNVSWREKGIPIWLSFAFWQWWMMAFLWLGYGVLMSGLKNNKRI